MKVLVGLLIALGAAASAHAQAPEPGPWRIVGSPGEPGHALIIGFNEPPNTGYVFHCAKGGVAATNIGVTQITDLGSDKVLGDEPGSQVTPATSPMGLMTGEALAPVMRRAIIRPNPTRGWDLSIGIPFNDPALKTLGRAKLMSLMTLGTVQAVSLSPQDRELFKAFIAVCKKA